nr:hypothetical protein [Tanacetum cinerariifolium]
SYKEPDVLIIHSTPTPVVPIIDEATTQNDARKGEADRLGLAFPSLNPILGIGTASIGSSISGSSTPPVSVGSTPLMSLCVSTIIANQYFISAGKSHVSAGRPIFAGKPSGSADRTPVPAGRILGKFTSSASSERFPRASNVELLDIHDGLKIFDCPKSGIFTSSSYDEEFSGLDANNLESSLDVSSTITKRIHNFHPTLKYLVISTLLYKLDVRSNTRVHLKVLLYPIFMIKGGIIILISNFICFLAFCLK